MFQSSQRSRRAPEEAAVDLAPLIDVVFILLIFFLVTATFDPDLGVDVERPSAASSSESAPDAIRVVIAPSGATYLDSRPVTIEQVASRVARSQVPVVVVPDRSVPSGRLIEVMDAVRLAGASDVTVATSAQGGRR
ncbi:MAG: biopolymer transporter ExbD [Planctomycetota bacterium]